MVYPQMVTRIKVRLACCVSILVGIGLTLLPLASAPAAGEVAVIANPNVPINDLSFGELRRVFLGERQFWSSSLRITLLMHGSAARDRDVLLRSVYEMSEAQFRQHWIGKVFRAEAASTPQSYYSGEEILEALAAIPGSIAAVETARIPRGLKAIRIDGRLPGEPGYRLH